MSSKTLKQEDITNFVTNTLILGGQYIVTPDYRIRDADEPEVDIIFTDDVTGKSYIWHTYSTDIKVDNAVICFPFVEAKGSISKDMMNYYHSLSAISMVWVFRIMKTAIKMALGTDGLEPNPVFIDLVSKVKGRVDNKTLKELDDLFNASVSDWGSIFYNKSKGSATLIMGLDDLNSPMFKSSPKLRNKTKDVLIDLVRQLLNVPDDNDIKDVYVHHLESGNVKFPRFESFMNVYIRVWESIAKYVECEGESFEDTSLILQDIKNGFTLAPVMKEKAQWLQQTQLGYIKPREETVPVTPVQQPPKNAYVPQQQQTIRLSSTPAQEPIQVQDKNVWKPGFGGVAPNTIPRQQITLGNLYNQYNHQQSIPLGNQYSSARYNPYMR